MKVKLRRVGYTGDMFCSSHCEGCYFSDFSDIGSPRCKNKHEICKSNKYVKVADSINNPEAFTKAPHE